MGVGNRLPASHLASEGSIRSSTLPCERNGSCNFAVGIMPELAEINALIEQTKEALERIDRELYSSPDDRSLRVVRASLVKRQGELTRQLEQATVFAPSASRTA